MLLRDSRPFRGEFTVPISRGSDARVWWNATLCYGDSEACGVNLWPCYGNAFSQYIQLQKCRSGIVEVETERGLRQQNKMKTAE